MSLFCRKHRYNDCLLARGRSRTGLGVSVCASGFCCQFSSKAEQRLLRFNMSAFWIVSFTEEHSGPFRSVCSRWDLSHWQTEQTHSWGSSRALLSVGTVCLKSFLLKKEQSGFTIIRSASTLFSLCPSLFSNFSFIFVHHFCFLLILLCLFYCPHSLSLLLSSSFKFSLVSFHFLEIYLLLQLFFRAVWDCLAMILHSDLSYWVRCGFSGRQSL